MSIATLTLNSEPGTYGVETVDGKYLEFMLSPHADNALLLTPEEPRFEEVEASAIQVQELHLREGEPAVLLLEYSGHEEKYVLDEILAIFAID